MAIKFLNTATAATQAVGDNSTKIATTAYADAAASAIPIGDYLPLSAGASKPLTGGLYIPHYIYHAGDTGTFIGFPSNDRLIIGTNGVTRVDITNSGFCLGDSGSNISVSTILDEDDMASDSATALVTQQSIKAYVDAQTPGAGVFLPLAGGTMAGSIAMSNFNISGVNQININDPGEGIVFQGTTNVTLLTIDDATDSILKISNASALQVNAKITNLTTPTSGGDATNKTYVDNAVAGVPQGDITAVVAGNYLTGGGTSGSVTLNGDNTKLAHIVDSSNGSVTSGWITVAQAASSRKAGEIYVTDGESSDHSYIRIEWMRSYADTNFTVLNCGGHANRITGVRVLQETADVTYGKKYLQIQVTATSNYYVIVTAPGTIPNYGDLIAETPVLENTKTGYAVTGAQLEDLQNSSVGTHEGITVGEELYVNGTGDSYFLGNVGMGTTSPIGKLYVGPTWDTSSGGNDLYIKSTSVDNSSYDPQVTNTSDLGITMVRDSATTTGPDTVGLTLYNDDGTAGGFSPMLLFSKLETPTSQFKATMAGIYARSPLGTGNNTSWIDGELIFATAGAASQGIKQRMVINKEGNVGIGTASPDYKLDVDGDIRARDAIRVYGNTVTSLPYNSPPEVSVNLGTYNNQYAYIDLATSHSGGSWIDFSKADGTDYGGRIRYANSLDQFQFFTNNSRKMVIDSAGNVGIGTDSPSAKLEVNGAVFVGNHTGTVTPTDGIWIEGADGTETQIQMYSLNGSVFHVKNAATKATIGYGSSQDRSVNFTNSGSGDISVGIGTDSPRTKLNVSGSSAAGGGVLTLENSTTATGSADYVGKIQFYGNDSGTGASGIRASIDANIQGYNGETDLVFSTAPASGVNAEAMRIDQNGNVGIGTTNPDTKLEIYKESTVAPTFLTLHGYSGDTTSNGTQGGFIDFKKTDGNATFTPQARIGMLVRDSTGDNGVISEGCGNLVFHTSRGTNSAGAGEDVERMRITDIGNVGIGTTGPNAKLELSSAQPRIRLRDTTTGVSSGYTTGAIDFYTSDASSEGNAVNAKIESYADSIYGRLGLRFFTGGGGAPTQAMTVNWVGDVGIGTTTPGYKLDVSGNGKFSNTSEGSLIIKHNYGYQRPNWAIKLDGDANTSGGYLSQYVNQGGFALNQGGTYYGGGPHRTDANSTSFSSVSGVNGELSFYTNTSLTASTNFTPSERMRITSGGNVGIGATNTTTKLTVEGGHTTARMNLYYNGSTNQRNAYIDMWASEPGVTYNGSGIGSNINGSPYYGRKVAEQGQSYIRFLNGAFEVWAGAAASGTASVAAKRLTIEAGGSVELNSYTSTSYKSYLTPISPIQNFYPSSGAGSDTTTDLGVDQDGNVVRTTQEATWHLTDTQVDAITTGTTGTTLLSAPGAGLILVVEKVTFMIKFTYDGQPTSMSTTQKYEIKQATNGSTNEIAVMNGGKVNDIACQGDPTGAGIYEHDTGYSSLNRTYNPNQATVIRRTESSSLPPNVTNMFIKMRYRVYDPSTF